jgi:hypothetical protein
VFERFCTPSELRKNVPCRPNADHDGFSRGEFDELRKTAVMNFFRRIGPVLTFYVVLVALLLSSIIPQAFKSDWAEFILKFVTGLGVISSVLAALFMDRLRARFDPIDLEIAETPIVNSHSEQTSLSGAGGVQTVAVYLHHLRVVNHSRHRAVTNCRVWLKRIQHWQRGEWTDAMESPVPRLFPWAPSEFDADKRTFAIEQVFDFAFTVGTDNEFRFVVHKDQGGIMSTLRFLAPAKLRATLYCSADNYTDTKEFVVEIDTHDLSVGPKRAKVRVLSCGCCA